MKTVDYESPRDSGRYSFIRSSEHSEAMMMGEEARFIDEYNRWIEYIGCGYACERDAWALREADEIDSMEFYKDITHLDFKEAFYDFQYGDTYDEVSHAFFYLTEYVGNQERTFTFSLDDRPLQEVKDYVAAIEKWHCTGELNIGPYTGVPNYRPWEKR